MKNIEQLRVVIANNNVDSNKPFISIGHGIWSRNITDYYGISKKDLYAISSSSNTMRNDWIGNIPAKEYFITKEFYDKNIRDFKVEKEGESPKRDWRNTKVGDTVLFQGKYSNNYYSYVVKRLADEGKAMQDENNGWHNFLDKDIVFVEIL